jgi:uncharacterized protein YciI
MPLFAVTRTRGDGWQPDQGLDGQQQWREHADFMNGLAAEGIVVLGGPLEGTPDILLVMRADGADTIRQRLNDDPWTNLELLRVVSVTPWTLRLGALPGGASLH